MHVPRGFLRTLRISSGTASDIQDKPILNHTGSSRRPLDFASTSHHDSKLLVHLATVLVRLLIHQQCFDLDVAERPGEHS